MPGLFGGLVDEGDLQQMAARTYRREIHDSELHDLGDAAVGMVHHGASDPAGHAVVQDGSVIGAVYGVVSNPEVDFSVDLVRRVLDRPADVLRGLKGPFLLACADRAANRLVVATDKGATRSCYYTREGCDLAFGSELSSLLPLVSDPTLDEQAVGDLLLMGHVWGPKTLVEEVTGLPPAHVLEYDGGTVSVRQYWDYSFGTRSDGGYVPEVARVYQDTISRVADTIDSRPGVWLSGGLDSRMMSISLKRSIDAFRTFTYNRPLEYNHPWLNDDTDIASRVADALGTEHATLTTTADSLRRRLPDLVEMTDGMAGWHTLSNLSAAFDLPTDEVDVVLEGSAHSLLCGEHVPTYSLHNGLPVAEELRRMHERADPDTVGALLSPDVDLDRTFVSEVERTDYDSRTNAILGITNANYYAWKHYMTNKVSRAFVGTREPFAEGRFLDLMVKMPDRYRQETLPFTSGTVPLVPSRMKLELTREIDSGGERFPYEMTQLRPTRHYRAHNVAFFLRTAGRRALVSRSVSDWYRHDDRFRERIDDLLDAAAERPVFDADAVEAVGEGHRRGEDDYIFPISGVTTVELFLRNVLER
jgi:asparagine synthase (glutamine-hydrolysing)